MAREPSRYADLESAIDAIRASYDAPLDINNLDSAALEKAIDVERARGRVPMITDLPTTVLRLRTATREHEVRCYALDFYAEKLPALKPLQQLHALEHRLARYMVKLRTE